MLKTITARHFDLSDKMREKAEDEMDSLKKYFDNIISAELILATEKHSKIAELKVRVYNQTLASKAETDEFYSSIASSVEKMISQLKKYKGKLKDKNPEKIAGVIDELTKPSTDTEGME